MKKTFYNQDYIWMLCEIDMNKLSENMKRINITITEKLLSKIDNFAKIEGENRSGFLAQRAPKLVPALRHFGTSAPLSTALRSAHRSAQGQAANFGYSQKVMLTYKKIFGINMMNEFKYNKYRLRKPQEKDAQGFIEISKDWNVMKFYGENSGNCKTISESLEQIKWCLKQFEKNAGRWIITEVEKDEYIGDIGFSNYLNKHKRAELGYRLKKQFRNQGIISYFISQLIKWGSRCAVLIHGIVIDNTARSNKNSSNNFSIICF